MKGGEVGQDREKRIKGGGAVQGEYERGGGGLTGKFSIVWGKLFIYEIVETASDISFLSFFPLFYLSRSIYLFFYSLLYLSIFLSVIYLSSYIYLSFYPLF